MPEDWKPFDIGPVAFEDAITVTMALVPTTLFKSYHARLEE